MANCSYARCEQERRFIKRELQKWTKNMVYIVGLERVAEELMGRRKWKLYQEVITRSHSNSNSVNNLSTANTTETAIVYNNNVQQNLSEDEQSLSITIGKEHQQQNTIENLSKENEVVSIKSEQINIKQEPKFGATEIAENQIDSPSTPIKVEIKAEPQNHCTNNNCSVADSDRPDTPIDWKPQDKCYFCVDGKLLTVNNRGDLVAESGPVQTEPDLANRTRIESDSDSSDCSDSEVQNTLPSTPTTAPKSVADLLRHTLPQQNMTSFESMAAQLATIASLNGFPPMYPGILYNPFVQQMQTQANTVASAAVTTSSVSPNSKPSNDTPTEQPLDLSAKPTSASSYNQNDPKQVFRAKPRMSTVAGRRTYTEEELQNALQDILSGKLGTRRAAVLYGIPRSTLRNKVYKLAMEHKREVPLMPPVVNVLDALDQDDDDKDGSGAEDDKDIEKSINSSVLSSENLLRLSAARSSSALTAGSNTSKYGSTNSMYDSNPHKTTPTHSMAKEHQSTKSQIPPTTSQTPPIATNPWLDPVMLQNLILAGGFMQQKYDDPAFQELFRNLLIQQQELMKEQMKTSATNSGTTAGGSSSEHLNNGKAGISGSSGLVSGSSADSRHFMHNLSMLQQHQNMHSRLLKSDTPDTASSVDPNDAIDDPAVILKIPSYKPVAGSSSSSKNGENTGGDTTPHTTSPSLMSRSPQSHMARMSPAGMSGGGGMLHRPPAADSESPPLGGPGILSLKDVIAKSITRTFNQTSPDATSSSSKPSIDQYEQYKRPSISVIKSLGGTDMSRFGASPNMMNSGNSSNRMNPNNDLSLGGKGTRPKRGKYRNYDRDSLVEAVKAVQRGEMSVHRAGSYYGVPHSTLEYKVKERHLMRPRKREPKPQPMDGISGGGSSSSINKDIGSSSGSVASSLRTLDKSKPMSTTKPPLNTPPFPATSPNGLKMGIFDPNQLQYAPHLFWPHPPGYTGLPMDFARSTASSAAANTPPGFPANAESFFASQMMQRFQEDALRQAGVNNTLAAAKAASSSSSSSASSSAVTLNNSHAKTAREMAESLYDGTSANGSFLDGIIRHSLDRKAGDIPHGALLDQLVKNSRHSDDGSATSLKRSGTPLHFAQTEIKRERTSPSSSAGDTDHESIDRDIGKDTVEHLLKYRDGLTLRLDDKSSLRSSVEDLNGDSPEHEKSNKHHTDNEDSS